MDDKVTEPVRDTYYDHQNAFTGKKDGSAL